MVNTGCILWLSKKFTSKTLYKHLLRECEKLPCEANEYYKHSIRQSYKQHVLETDTSRINQIIQRALEDAEWVMKKYGGKMK